MIALTLHAQQRCQQRAIPEVVIDLLFEYGKACNTRGGEIYHFTTSIIERLRKSGAARVARIIEDYRRCYLVCCGGQIVTVGHRYKRLRDKPDCLHMHRRLHCRRRRTW